MGPSNWPQPWQTIPPDQRAGFEAQLQRELTPGHPLYGVAAVAAARGLGGAVMFTLPSHTRPLAVVHLTGQSPQRDPWPQTEFFDSLADLSSARE